MYKKFKNQQILLDAIIFIFILGFQTTSVYAYESNEQKTVIVHIDEKGFQPNKINIEVGTRVVFENIGKEDYWPASDDHPSHTLYDGTSLKEHCARGASTSISFDACGPIKSTKSWEFIFTKEGVYEYHDHLWPQLTGEVVVGKSVSDETKINTQTNDQLDASKKQSYFSKFKSYVKKTISTIFGLFGKGLKDNKEEGSMSKNSLKAANGKDEYYLNLKNRFEKIVNDSDPKEAIRLLREESSKNEKTQALCHDVLHVIGHTAYGKYGSFKEAVKYQEDFCNSGYIHGLFESYFKSTESSSLNLSEQCWSYGKNKRLFDLWQCYHGIGHGLMYLTGGDLDKSLQMCKDDLQDLQAVANCKNGVYMEVFNSEVLAKEKSFVDSKKPFATCSQRKTSKGDCYIYAPTYFSQTLEMSYEDIFKECSKTEIGYKYVCIEGVGAEMLKRNMSDLSSVFDLCKKAGEYMSQEACVSGVVNMYMNQEGSYTAGEEICKIAPESYQDFCYKTVKKREMFFR